MVKYFNTLKTIGFCMRNIKIMLLLVSSMLVINAVDYSTVDPKIYYTGQKKDSDGRNMLHLASQECDCTIMNNPTFLSLLELDKKVILGLGNPSDAQYLKETFV